jgi:hypothetical protein
MGLFGFELALFFGLQQSKNWLCLAKKLFFRESDELQGIPICEIEPSVLKCNFVNSLAVIQAL